MAFLSTRTNGTSQGTINANWYNDFMQALTGVMNDQPIYMYYQPSAGSNPPALKLRTNGNAHLLQGFNCAGKFVIAPASGYDGLRLVAKPASTYACDIGFGDTSYGSGAGLYCWDEFNSGLVFYGGTHAGITFTGTVKAANFSGSAVATTLPVTRNNANATAPVYTGTTTPTTPPTGSIWIKA
jgi:hypothetical protein